ncbi:TonB-dependent receptor [Altererythrobacter lutimaris]|uniref:TonB-dependent receptor n=1 Tax=Altererythrobacter lutimaris TaxID=2743979 RepID=A0A850H7C0_9SPHN|nr:TonB-dependent receptor [Altererythrobacter lutimaris]NVE93450.1 TonB-dependent receptor [Altererythrobacter lutimaris]
MKTRFLAGAAVAAFTLPATAVAGDVTGVVVDASDTIALQAAELTIEELGRKATAGSDGRYRFNEVPGGTYTIVATYIGAEPVRQTITVPETGTVELNFVLGDTGGDILVIGQSANQASALSRKRASDIVADVLTRDAIGQFPDQNVAESLRRLPGVNILNDQGEGRFVSVRGLDPELVATSLNGVRLPAPESDTRSVALDVVSSDIIESITVKKSLTPDMDGDTIGASVEIETTSAFNRTKDLLTIKAEGSYNDYAGELTPKISLDFSNRLSDSFGVSGGVSFYNRKFETDNIEADGYVDAGGAVFPIEVQYRDYDVERERISATLGFDIRASDSTELYVKGIWSQFDDQEFRRRLRFDLDDFEDFGPTSVNGTSAIFDDTTVNIDGDDVRQRIGVRRDIKDRFERQRIRSITAGGESDLGDWFAEYAVSWAKSTETEDGNVDPTEFRERFSDDGLTIGFDYSDPRLPLYSVINDGVDFFNPATYPLNDIEFTVLSDSEDEEYAAQFDLGRRFQMDSGEFTVQAGFKGRWREKGFSFDVEFYEFNEDFGEYLLSDVLGEDATYRITDLNPLPGFTQATDFFFANRDQFELQELDSAFDSSISDYAVKEDIMAGYLLGRWETNDLRVIGGVRYEHTSNTLNGNLVTLNEDTETVTVAPVNFERDYDIWLPSLNIRYEAQPDLILRLAGYRSLVRPRLSAVAPRFAVEENDEGEREGEFGNPALQPFKAWNFDASAEWYMSSNGALTAAFFYKDIKDYIINEVREDSSFNGIPFDEAVVPINGDSATVLGFELGLSQSLKGALDGFIIQANYTFTDADGTVFQDGDPTNPRSIPLPATSKHTGNISLGYDKGPFDIRLSGTYRDSYLDELESEAALDRYVDDHFQLDLSAKYRLTDNIQFFYEWVNINNAKYFAFNRFGNQVNNLQYEEYSWTMKGGVRINF